MSSKKFNAIGVLMDNPNSWMWEYIELFLQTLKDFSKTVTIYRSARELKKGDILFILSCDQRVKPKELQWHKHNIVIHASDLPKGKGWSPVSWQIEQGINKIPITLFEANPQLDDGDWYLKDHIETQGHELIHEIRYLVFKTLHGMAKTFLSRYPLEAHPQNGEESFFDKRTEKNQELNVTKSIQEEFNKLRVCDNERYPAHFTLHGHTYIIKISKT